MREAALLASRRWVERVVLGLSLCPWAAPVHERRAIRYAYTDAALPGGERALHECALREVQLLATAAHEHTTTVIVAPQCWPQDFVAFNAAVVALEDILTDLGLGEDVQAVAFHPHFRFAGEPAEDAGNFVNRSPHPMVHLLRQGDVTDALDDQDDRGHDVAQSNRQRLQALGSPRLRELLRSVSESGSAGIDLDEPGAG